MAGFCDYYDEPSGSGTTELVSLLVAYVVVTAYIVSVRHTV
jgi:hypothetical protein